MPSRHRKPRPHASAQERLSLSDVVGDVVVLRGGECRAVLRAGSVNFALKSEAEQEAILAGYRRFLNGLDYPLQVLVRVVPTDVEGYLEGVRGGPAGDEALRRLALDHESFVRRLAHERTFLDRRFFVVVPAGIEGPAGRQAPRWPGHRRRHREGAGRDLGAARRRLAFRCSEIAQGLGAFGVETRRLASDELVALWCATLGVPAARPHRRGPTGGPAVIARGLSEAPDA